MAAKVVLVLVVLDVFTSALKCVGVEGVIDRCGV